MRIIFSLAIALLASTVALTQQLPDVTSLKGKTVYVCADGDLHQPNLKNPQKIDWGNRLDASEYGALWIAVIKDAQVYSTSYGSHTIALLLTLKNGKDAVIPANLPEDESNLQGDKLLDELMIQGGNRSFRTRLPIGLNWLSTGSNIERGADRQDVSCLLGLPDHRNDYGDGREQWVYQKAQTYVYVSKGSGKVTGVQKLNQ